jgi:integrase
MASLFRRTYMATDRQTGESVRRRAKRWYGKYRDGQDIERTVPLATDRTASQQMLNALVREAELERVGIVDPFAAHRRLPLREHLAAFLDSLRHAGRPDAYVRQLGFRVGRCLDACGFRLAGDLSASRVQSFLADLRNQGTGQKTVNDYLQAVKQFSRWLVADRRTGETPLAFLKGGNAALDVRRERRELTEDEIRRLLQQARHCTNRRFTLPGPERFMLYAVALGTGLRSSELGSLTPEHFDLKAAPPTVRIDAPDEKARRGAVLPVSADLAGLLRPWLAEKAAGCPVWSGPWALNQRAGKFLKVDLANARQAWIDEASDEGERTARDESDFLRYKDSAGRYADFHALRHTFLSRLGRSGASPKAMQMLARHTTVQLTLGRYTHASLHDLDGAVNALPPLPTDAPSTGRDELRATGTDGRVGTLPAAPSAAPKLHQAGDAGRLRLRIADD